jgi:hypothetical protein
MKIKPIIIAALFTISTLGFALPASASTTKPTYFTPAESEVKVREYFKDIPVMIEIARCESNFRQFTDSGSVLRGGDSGGMIGVFQFFESVHASTAKSLGYDLATLDGNLTYAKYVYALEGTAPWNPARDCWDIKPSTIKPTLNRVDLESRIKNLIELIKLLQRLQELKSKQH